MISHKNVTCQISLSWFRSMCLVFFLKYSFKVRHQNFHFRKTYFSIFKTYTDDPSQEIQLLPFFSIFSSMVLTSAVTFSQLIIISGKGKIHVLFKIIQIWIISPSSFYLLPSIWLPEARSFCIHLMFSN